MGDVTVLLYHTLFEIASKSRQFLSEFQNYHLFDLFLEMFHVKHLIFALRIPQIGLKMFHVEHW